MSDWAERLAAAKPGERKELYGRYLCSGAWKAKRAIALERAGHRCQTCNSERKLHVHHRTYDRIGDEDPADLTVLCERCHNAISHRLGHLRRSSKKTQSKERRPCSICKMRKTTKGTCGPCRKEKKLLKSPKPKGRAPSVKAVRKALRLGRSLTVADLERVTGMTPAQVNGAIGAMNVRNEIKRDGKRWRLG